jgi:hypothetical protein
VVDRIDELGQKDSHWDGIDPKPARRASGGPFRPEGPSLARRASIRRIPSKRKSLYISRAHGGGIPPQ